jgi:four helix bundle protein
MPKQYDLEARSLQFAMDARLFIRRVPRTISNIEDCKQLARASGSVGANYIEANEALGKKDFLMHVKICRKEAKESAYWLQLLDIPEELTKMQKELVREATELMMIFSAIMRKSS